MSNSGFPDLRLRRLRQNDAVRNMLADPLPGPEKFIWPIFVVEGKKKKLAIEAMPGQFRMSVDQLAKEIEPVAKMGIGGLMVFGVVEDSRKSRDAEYAYAIDGVVQQAVREIKEKFPPLLIFTDVCVCAYTDHGHCGVLDENGEVANDPSLNLLSKMAVSHAAAGADGVAPSAMMDGQVIAIRESLDDNGFLDTILMSYSSKFASAMYGPFREAAESTPAKGDRKGYQADYRNLDLALLESLLDEQEGADILMVKPALFYLDIIARIKEMTALPVAAYNVSGEYSMIIAAAERGWGERNAMVREAVAALARAGTDIIISYWANQYKEIF